MPKNSRAEFIVDASNLNAALQQARELVQVTGGCLSFLKMQARLAATD